MSRIFLCKINPKRVKWILKNFEKCVVCICSLVACYSWAVVLPETPSVLSVFQLGAKAGLSLLGMTESHGRPERGPKSMSSTSSALRDFTGDISKELGSNTNELKTQEWGKSGSAWDTLKQPQWPSQERLGLGLKGLGWLWKKKDKTRGLEVEWSPSRWEGFA